VSKPVVGDTPTDRLTRICDAMTFTFNRHPEHHEGDKCMVLLDDGDHGGIVLDGYEDTAEAMTDLLMHLRAIFRGSGKRLDIMFMDDDGVSRIDGAIDE
jgi:hypothetical protein